MAARSKKARSDPPPAVAEPVADAPRSAPSPYTVVARRYRPQRFEDVVGQDHVVQALRNAIRLNRLAQAYLFCGTRGVGKTSMARIFAKCLNCVNGPTEEPCQKCDICQSIALGQDVDVIEIDGASNNGVEQVRELRQNASLRPSRARFKIYYIDEVHMLSTGAFNALLKTLEEPPSHVKFFFATTEATKIPITVLSRCQRYDFAGITPEIIAATLSDICAREGVAAEPEALQIVARRATGSLRDAQSLLDRLLASGSAGLSVEVVNALLGTASDERLLAMIEALADHDPAAALRLFEQSTGEGVQPAEFLAGLIDFMRDALVLAVGAESMLLSVSSRQRPHLKRIVDRWTVDSIMAAMQILSECRARMRGSLHGRLLVELALVRVARLEDLTAIGSLIDRLAALESGTPAARKPELARRERSQAALDPVVSPRADAAPPPPPEHGASSAVDKPAAPTVGSHHDAARGPAINARPSEPPTPRPSEPPTPRPSEPPPPRPSEPPPPQSERPASVEAPPARPVVLAESGPREANALAEAAIPPQRSEPLPLELPTVRKVWPELVKKVGASLGWRLSQVEPTAVLDPDVLVIAAKPGYNSVADECGNPEPLAKIEQALQRLIHRAVTVKYERSREADDGGDTAPAADGRGADILSSHPMVQKLVELFEARSLQVEYEDTDRNQPP